MITTRPEDVSAVQVVERRKALFNSSLMADVLVGLGAAYSAYIFHWSRLTTLLPADLFWLKSPPSAARYGALVLSTILLGLVCCAAIRMTRRRGVAAVAGCSILVVVGAVAVNSVRDLLTNYYEDLGGNVLRSISGVKLIAVVGVAAPLLAVAFIFLVRHTRKLLLESVRFVLILFSLLGFWNMCRGAYQAASPPSVGPVAPSAAYLPQSPGGTPKIVWVVFDEFDYRLAFVDRLRDLSLPVLDKFAETSIVASHAYPPFSSTGNSLLTYISGERVAAMRPVGANDLVVRTAEHPQRRHWKDVTNLFAAARGAGVNGAVVGWYLPYSKLLGSDLVDCWWFDRVTRDTAVGERLPEMLVKLPRSLIETSLLSPFGQSLLTKRRIGQFDLFMAKTRELLEDARVRLLLLHIPVPHTPYFYDRRTGESTLANSMILGYWDSLALVDRTLGDIEASLKQAGEWDNSVVLVGSDHFYRTAMRIDGRMDHRIPFLLKMPRQRRRFSFDAAFNAQVAHNLILEIARRHVRTDEEALAWLQQYHSAVPVGWKASNLPGSPDDERANGSGPPVPLADK